MQGQGAGVRTRLCLTAYAGMQPSAPPAGAGLVQCATRGWRLRVLASLPAGTFERDVRTLFVSYEGAGAYELPKIRQASDHGREPIRG